MIEFYSENDFQLEKEEAVSKWITTIIEKHDFQEGDITYVFCDDAYLHKLNVQFLEHDTLTDIITFDNSLGRQVHAEIYISIERVAENAVAFESSFTNELHRVIIHGVLHLLGLKDKSKDEEAAMRLAEDEALSSRSFA